MDERTVDNLHAEPLPDPADEPSELPPFNPSAAPDSSGHAEAPAAGPAAPEAAPPAQGAPQPSRPDKGFEAMQRRIKRLFAQKRAAEEEITAERQRREQLEARLRELESRIAYQPPPPAYPAPDPYGFAAPAARADAERPAANPGPDFGVLQAAIQRAVQPLVERLNQREQLDALAFAHEQSWEAAEEEFPEVAQNGALRKTAQRILSQDAELARSPNGPYRAVLIARGLLADAAAPEAAKRAAGTVIGAAQGEGASRFKLEAEYRELLKKGIFNATEWARARQLKQQLDALRFQE